MNTDLRNRVVLPIVLPLVVLLGMAVLVGGLALILLYSPHEVGLMVAVVAGWSPSRWPTASMPRT